MHARTELAIPSAPSPFFLPSLRPALPHRPPRPPDQAAVTEVNQTNPLAMMHALLPDMIGDDDTSSCSCCAVRALILRNFIRNMHA
jgi:hypothetical protein